MKNSKWFSQRNPYYEQRNAPTRVPLRSGTLDPSVRHSPKRHRQPSTTANSICNCPAFNPAIVSSLKTPYPGSIEPRRNLDMPAFSPTKSLHRLRDAETLIRFRTGTKLIGGFLWRVYDEPARGRLS